MPDSDYGLTIAHRPDLPAVLARWQREISADELRHGYLAILAAADACGCWRWLLDLRRRNELIGPEVSEWMTDDFFPRLVGRFGQPVRVAFLLSPLRAQREPPLDRPSQPPTHEFATFIDEAPAYAWLAR